MIYTPMTQKAMSIAYNAHHGQVDQSGVPYILHPVHLAEQMDDEISCCVALLHDVAEDTDVTLEQLAKEFPEEVVDALKLMTHQDGTDYYDYVRAIGTNPIAKKVKLADIAHNSDATRRIGTSITPEQSRRWDEKYAKARSILLND